MEGLKKWHFKKGFGSFFFRALWTMFMYAPQGESKKNVHVMEEWGRVFMLRKNVSLLGRALIRKLICVYRLLHIQTKYKREECPTDNMLKQVSTYKLACAQR